MKKILTVFLILVICISFIANFSYAAQYKTDTGGGGGSVGNGSEGGSFVDQYKPEIGDGGAFVAKANVIIGAVQMFGSGISVIALIIIGIRFLLSSVEEKAQYKELMLPYIIGAVMVFFIVNILGIISALIS